MSNMAGLSPKHIVGRESYRQCKQNYVTDMVSYKPERTSRPQTDKTSRHPKVEERPGGRKTQRANGQQTDEHAERTEDRWTS